MNEIKETFGYPSIDGQSLSSVKASTVVSNKYQNNYNNTVTGILCTLLEKHFF